MSTATLTAPRRYIATAPIPEDRTELRRLLRGGYPARELAIQWARHFMVIEASRTNSSEAGLAEFNSVMAECGYAVKEDEGDE